MTFCFSVIFRKYINHKKDAIPGTHSIHALANYKQPLFLQAGMKLSNSNLLREFVVNLIHLYGKFKC
jgi:hypothetical protein